MSDAIPTIVLLTNYDITNFYKCDFKIVIHL